MFRRLRRQPEVRRRKWRAQKRKWRHAVEVGERIQLRWRHGREKSADRFVRTKQSEAPIRAHWEEVRRRRNGGRIQRRRAGKKNPSGRTLRPETASEIRANRPQTPLRAYREISGDYWKWNCRSTGRRFSSKSQQKGSFCSHWQTAWPQQAVSCHKQKN